MTKFKENPVLCEHTQHEIFALTGTELLPEYMERHTGCNDIMGHTAEK